MSLPAYEGLRLPGSAASPAGLAVTPDARPGAPARARLTRPEPPRTSPRSAALRLVGAEQGCGQARDFVRRTLADWSVDHCGADALTVVAELLANAVLHAAPHATVRPPSGGEAEIWLKLSLRRTAHLVCAVTDPSDNPPVYPHTSEDPFDEHGRGLRIIDALSEHWGWTRLQPAGKTVWAMLRTDRQA